MERDPGAVPRRLAEAAGVDSWTTFVRSAELVMAEREAPDADLIRLEPTRNLRGGELRGDRRDGSIESLAFRRSGPYGQGDLRRPAMRSDMRPRFALVALVLVGCTSTEDPSMSPSYPESRRLAIEHASTQQLLASLDELEAWHTGEGTTVAGRLAPGIGEGDLDEVWARLGAPLPADLVTLYQWHDGTRGGCDDFAGPAFLAYHCFLPLQQALDIRDRDRRLLGLPGSWLPVLYFQEEYVYVLLEDPAPSALPVFHRLVESDDVVAFTNLRAMVDTFLEAARAGVWQPDDDALVDWSAVETIRARLNPGTSPPWAP